ncbi:MAG TPA: GlsB/YeaQ/YmgE family stress response membrane protein [Smithellaceae bacterium]|jgi:uncharacterized membrane protein YeaQ/YmgE (transglycosylase-associated protein family)|nr:GlsB/YeaQ/YmgE family stress response membrane protein [Smithella sp.]HNZ10951.1 GlsB/YeaQ/YmgE family stress response membrane protein [Smithellaceae bacterium]HOG80930.1 GlsB/YeaQ/YmgE family stress response membrane protein [Smithellaceae bacterium]HOQ42217.1 GlsB/YeaQ/YmgE family stress response membrane protein [Smithellaceae bacterium]HPL65543.1 GlsB/YeaQ/YmgE family stress response membrane protein [Smithellaceae bacterium]
MGILTWIMMGIIVAIIAELITTDPGPGGIVITILVGSAGAFIGGFIGTFFGFGSFARFSVASLVLAVTGALVLVTLSRVLKKK